MIPLFCKGCREKKQCVVASLNNTQDDTYLSVSAWWLWKLWTFPPAGLCTEQADSRQDRVTAETGPHILSMVPRPLACLPSSEECCRERRQAHRFIVHHLLNIWSLMWSWKEDSPMTERNVKMNTFVPILFNTGKQVIIPILYVECRNMRKRWHDVNFPVLLCNI